MADKHKILEVTVKRYYYIPMIDNERSEINGWTIDQIIKDWFDDINQRHASRDRYEIGYSEKVHSVQTLTEGEFKHEMEEE